MNRQIPGPIEQRGALERSYDLSLPIEDEQRARRLDRGGSAVERGQAAHDDEAAFQNAQGGRQAQGTGGRRSLEEERLLTGWRNIDNRRAGPLQVTAVIEIGNEN